MEKIYGIQMFTIIDGYEVSQGRAKIFFGINAKITSKEYIEVFAQENNLKEITATSFNLRLFTNGTMYWELYLLESEHFVYNCN